MPSPLEVELFKKKSMLQVSRKRISEAALKLDDDEQYIAANALLLKVAGFVEDVTLFLFSSYASQRGSSELAKFTSWHIARMNSIDCDKIRQLCDRFAPTWWEELDERLDDDCKNAIDSVKSLRDRVAHGKQNGTGIGVISGYAVAVESYPDALYAQLGFN